MIDRVARDRFAELLRHFAAGILTNDEYEESAEQILKHGDRRDRLLWAMYSRVWYLYDDVRVHRLRGKHALNDSGRQTVARWVMFLYSDLEYEWPVKSFISPVGCLIRLCTLGLGALILNPMRERRLRRMGPWDLWPFFRQSDYHRTNAHPRLLSGARSVHD